MPQTAANQHDAQYYADLGAARNDPKIAAIPEMLQALDGLCFATLPYTHFQGVGEARTAASKAAAKARGE